MNINAIQRLRITKPKGLGAWYDLGSDTGAWGGSTDTGYTFGTSSGSTGFDWNALVSGFANLGSQYIQSQTAQNIAQTALQNPSLGYPISTQITPGGGIIATYPTTYQSFGSMLRNPLVLGALGIGAYLLLRKKK